MRKAAGIILIVSGIVGAIGLVIHLTGIYFELPRTLYIILWRIASAALLISGGVFCLRRRYWRVCLASAAVAVFIGAVSTIDYLRSIVIGRPLVRELVNFSWGVWILLVAGVIAVIFITRRRREWSEISDSVDGEVSDAV
jgi:hypothetical protein